MTPGQYRDYLLGVHYTTQHLSVGTEAGDLV